MKLRRPFLPLLAVCISCTSRTAAATDQYWKTGGSSVNWSVFPGDKNWNPAPGDPAGISTWPDSGDEVAVFQDAIGGTITVVDSVQAAGLSQNGASYTLNAGTITLVPDAAAAVPFIHTQTGTLTVDSELAGTSGLRKTGTDGLVLSGTNTYSGTTAVTAGSLTLTGSLASTIVDVSAGANLFDNSGGLAPATILTNAGTLTMGANDMVASYISNGGTLAAGLRTLNVTSAELNDGSSVAGNLNGPTLTTNGTVSISGSTYCQTTNIASGTLTLTGEMGVGRINIASGASLLDQSGGIGSRVDLTNAGSLTVDSANSVRAYVSNGGTLAAGFGLLSTGTADLNDGSTVAGLLETGNLTSNGSVVVSGSVTMNGRRIVDIASGTLTLTGTLTRSIVDIAAGASLLDQSGGLDEMARVTSAGTFTVNTAETIDRLINNLGTVNGSGTLTVTGATIFNGGTLAAPLTINGTAGGTFTNVTLAGTFNGQTSLNGATVSGAVNGNTTSTGDVLVSGTVGGGSLAVTGGTLTLTGSSTITPVSIAGGATLIDASGGLANTAAITNSGILTVKADDTIASYTQNSPGVLDGTATLTATDGIVLNGGTVAGKLNGNTTSTGDVLVSGTLGGGSLDVTGGTMTLTGITNQRPIHILSGGRLLVENSGLAFAPAVTNDGVLTFNGANMILSYTQNGTGTLNGTGVLETRSGSTLNGGTVAGNLRGSTISTGDVVVSGTLGDGLLDVTGGTLNLTGISTNIPVSIAGGATLIDASGGLSNLATLTNAGTLTVNAPDTILTYQSNGGTLTGTGSLTATSTASLFNGSLVSGALTATDLSSHGAVSITGFAGAQSIRIGSGVLTNTGTLTATGNLEIATGATLAANGTQSYTLLTTSGPGAGTWQGNLGNAATVAPGGIGSVGHLAVTGHFTNAPGATLNLDLGTGAHDLVTVGGSAIFGGTLALNQISPITPFVPIQVVDASAYSGSFTSLTETLDGAAWFNPNDGTVTTLAPPPAGGGNLWNSTANQTSTWIALYDDVIDPQLTNITRAADGSYQITSGIADANNPDLLNALSASFGSGGLDAAVLDRLSPEVYAGFQDYAIHATRSHQRAALEAPSLGFIQAPRPPQDAGAKHALAAPPAPGRPWEYFAAVDYFDAGTDDSPNHADYDLSGFGFIAGARTSLTDRVRVGGYFAVDSGTVDGALIDADATGWSLGLFAKALVHDRSHTLITGGLSYGKYSFDGSRSSLIATSGGTWSPAAAGFSNVDSDALELFLGASSLVYQNDRFRLLPTAGLRYVCGGMDGFTESAGGPGSPVALAVDEDTYQSALAELSLRGEADLTDRLALDGQIGYSISLGGDDPAVLNSRFASGSRSFRTTADGLDDDAFFLGLGATWQIRDNLGLGLHWRADFRSDADPENRVGLSAGFRF